ncbi:MAG: TetR/AcrR family transcriptional regulator [Actinomycetota bacterium]
MGRNPDTNARQRAETSAQLLEAGRRLFADRGLTGTTVDAIAAEAGCSKGLVYHYFPTKEALAEAILIDWLAQVATLAASVADIADPVDRLAGFARVMGTHVEANADGYRFNLRSLTDPALREVAAKLSSHRSGADHPWAEAFEALGSDDPVTDGQLFQTSLLGIFTHHVLSPVPTDVAGLVDRLVKRTLERQWTST